MCTVHTPAFADAQFRLIKVQGTVPVPPLTVIQVMTATIRHFDPSHLLPDIVVDPFATFHERAFENDGQEQMPQP